MLVIAVVLPAAALAIGYLLWGEVRRQRSGQPLVSPRRFRLRVAAGAVSLALCAVLFTLLFALPKSFFRSHPQLALGAGAFCLAAAVAIMFLMLADVQEVENRVKEREAELFRDFARLFAKGRDTGKDDGKSS